MAAAGNHSRPYKLICDTSRSRKTVSHTICERNGNLIFNRELFRERSTKNIKDHLIWPNPRTDSSDGQNRARMVSFGRSAHGSWIVSPKTKWGTAVRPDELLPALFEKIAYIWADEKNFEIYQSQEYHPKPCSRQIIDLSRFPSSRALILQIYSRETRRISTRISINWPDHHHR